MLGTSYALLLKIWTAHWNMKGESFHSDHLWFNDLYEEMIDVVDSIAERVRAMEGLTLLSLAEMQEHSLVQPWSTIVSIPELKEGLLRDYETFIKQIRDSIATLNPMQPQDDGDLNFLQDLCMKLEKDSWMLRASRPNVK